MSQSTSHPDTSTARRAEGGVVHLDVNGDGVVDRIEQPAAKTGDGGEVAQREARPVEPYDPPQAVTGPGMDTVTATVVTGPPAIGAGELRPIVPGWMRSWDGWKGTTRWWLRVQWHAFRFHMFRLPTYAVRALIRAPRGTCRVVAGTVRWALDTRADGLEQDLATGTKADSKEFRQLRENRSARIKWRSLVVAVVLGILVTSGVIIYRGQEPAVQAAVSVATFLVLAIIGSDPGKPLIGQTMTATPGHREITDTIVMRALRAAGLAGQPAKVDKDGNVTAESTLATLAAPIARSANGRGTEILVDVTYGKTAGDAAENLGKLASAMDVAAAQVFVEPVKGSERRVAIYVADDDPFLRTPHRSPMARMPKVSVWDQHPIARTPLGREVKAPLLFASYLVGAVPRAGKSFAAKCLTAPAVLDPYCDVTGIDCKGGRDWLALSEVATHFQTGDDEEDLARAVAILRQLQQAARARFAQFRDLSDLEMPEDKLTRELARAGMRPHIIIVDEIQNLLRAASKEIRQESLDVLTWLAKSAPAAGFSLVAITQRPAAEVIPADLRDVMTVRIALRTRTRQNSDAILGTDISATGFRTDRFDEAHKGAAVIGGISTGRGGDLQVARTDLFTPTDFTKACAIGRQRRIDAGTLRGQAAGEREEFVVEAMVVEDVDAVWPGDQAKVQAWQIVERLREHFGDRYPQLDEAALTRMLKPRGVPSIQVFRDNTNRQGYALADVRRARRVLAAAADEPQDAIEP
ncbi:hypothetical protein ACIB24_12550 [Spongisporangium articulatum]|uniref:Cell division protein FtsK n=1 Tax=Spongisporangium articulatum TaxID=3362603 RepID=A0ABW8AND4_9ACTN